MKRRSMIQAASAGMALAAAARLAPAMAAPPPGLKLGTPEPFSWEALIERARQTAKGPYVEPPRPDPAIVQQIDYDAYGKITYNPAYALYADKVYPITFKHVGMFFPKTIRMHAVDGGQSREILYSPDYFVMPDDHVAKKLGQEPSAFAGFWIQESIKHADWPKLEPWATFLGASYFRAVGELGQVGMSARGIAIGPGEATPEEFPDFVQWWFEPAASESDPTTAYALLDGPSISGAYKFLIRRNAGVVMDIENHLFARRDIERLCIAPLTSMFWMSEYQKRNQEDWRPEVHDSDGLALWTGTGERIWRPLNAPNRIITSSFIDSAPKGFGLSQRDRAFDHYLDGVAYERRPSVWIEPLGDWGKGAVQLIEIPTDDEIYDNIVTYWAQDHQVKAGDQLGYNYRLYWVKDEPFFPTDLAKVVRTGVGRGGQPGKPRPAGLSKFMIEFQGAVLEELWGWKLKAVPMITVSRGTVSLVQLEPVPTTRNWRAIFDVDAPGPDPVELRVYLKGGDRTLSETWLYQHSPA